MFDDEQRVLFERTWQVACLGADVKRDKDFVALQAGRVPIVVQNFKATLAALHNACSHRSSPLQAASRGNRGLHCPYHGWTYDASGVPVGIPHNDAFYGIAPDEAKCLAATSYPIERRGNLVFVCVDTSGTLAEQLGAWDPLIAGIGDALDDIYFQTTIVAQCNWKLLVHNAFDDIHAQFVHPKSSLDTSETVSCSWKSHPFDADRERIPENYAHRHAQFNVVSTEAARRANETTCRSSFANPRFAFDDYVHLFVFPNVVITSIQGLWYNIVRYRPTSPGTTEITL